MSQIETTLYERLGGEDGLAAMVEGFYGAVLRDAELAPFFERSDVRALAAMQREFLAAALDGPVTYTGAALGEIHAGRGITTRHVSRFFALLLDCLEAHGLDREGIDHAAAQLAVAVEEVTGATGEDG